VNPVGVGLGYVRMDAHSETASCQICEQVRRRRRRRRRMEDGGGQGGETN